MREGRQPRVRPVFLDRSGRRRRFAVLLGTGLATALLTGLGALAVALSGSTGVDIPGFPDADRRADAPEDGAPANTPGTTPAIVRPPAEGRTTSDATSVVATTGPVTPSSQRPGNGRNPTHTPPRSKPTRNR